MKFEYLTIIVLGMIVLSLIGYLAFENISETFLEIGYNQGQGDLIVKINNDALIPVINNQSVDWIQLDKLCGVGE